MREISRINPNEREELFLITAHDLFLPAAIIEKDFWVCWTLDYLFHRSPWVKHLTFKGGTSLSKCFGLIQRFSEDIDLILDWRLVGCEKDEPWAERSKNQQDKFNKAVNAKTAAFLTEQFVPQLRCDFNALLSEEYSVFIDQDDPQKVHFSYPRLFSEGSIQEDIILEIGPLASWTPTLDAVITPFAAEQYPHIFHQPSTILRTVTAERTFWEKATILHMVAFRIDGRVPPRYSRHYYDIWCMSNSPVKDRALQDLDLLHRVTEFKERFYPSGSAHYDKAKPGSLRLVPPDIYIKPLCEDYEHMKNMIFGPKPEFDTIITTIQALENEINRG